MGFRILTLFSTDACDLKSPSFSVIYNMGKIMEVTPRVMAGKIE